jgi:hypothetical protein
MRMAVHVILWVFVGALIVLVIKNAASFATAVSAVDTPILSSASLLSGAGIPSGTFAKAPANA